MMTKKSDKTGLYQILSSLTATAMATVFIAGCSTFADPEPTPAPQAAMAANNPAAAAPATTAPAATAVAADKPPVQFAPAPSEASATAVTAAAPTATADHAVAPAVTAATEVKKSEEPKGIEPDLALKWLKNGNNRFLKGAVRRDGQSQKDIQRLAEGQKPHAIVLSCSDSRVPPEITFDQKLGEIFVVRTAGESLNDNVIGSIEYAVSHLGSRLIVVMGHTSCGAIKAALGTLDGQDAGSPALNALVKDIHPRLQSYKGKTPSPHGHDEAMSNAEGVASDLLARSAIITDAVKNGSVKIVSALYDMDSGKVDFNH